MDFQRFMGFMKRKNMKFNAILPLNGRIRLTLWQFCTVGTKKRCHYWHGKVRKGFVAR